MDDIPKGIILVLLIVTVLISVLGTWTVMDQLTGMRVPYTPQEKASAKGIVAIKLIDPDAPAPPPPEPALATGDVALQIIEPEVQ